MPVVLYMTIMPLELRPSKVRIHTANIDAGWKMVGLLEKAGYSEIAVIPLGDDVLQDDLAQLRESLGKSDI